MSRFRNSRWAVIGVWTGAAVAWGTTAVLARQTDLPPGGGPAPAPKPVPVSSEHEVEPVLPAPPEGGLVVIRYTPSSDPEPEVITRYVAVRPAAAPTTAAPAPVTAAPAPRSGGS